MRTRAILSCFSRHQQGADLDAAQQGLKLGACVAAGNFGHCATQPKDLAFGGVSSLVWYLSQLSTCLWILIVPVANSTNRLKIQILV